MFKMFIVCLAVSLPLFAACGDTPCEDLPYGYYVATVCNNMFNCPPERGGAVAEMWLCGKTPFTGPFDTTCWYNPTCTIYCDNGAPGPCGNASGGRSFDRFKPLLDPETLILNLWHRLFVRWEPTGRYGSCHRSITRWS